MSNQQMDKHSPRRSEMRRSEWEWRYWTKEDSEARADRMIRDARAKSIKAIRDAIIARRAY